MNLHLAEVRAGAHVRVSVATGDDGHPTLPAGTLTLSLEDWTWLLGVLLTHAPGRIHRAPCALCSHPAHTGGLCHADQTTAPTPNSGPGQIRGCSCDDFNPAAVLAADLGVDLPMAQGWGWPL